MTFLASLSKVFGKRPVWLYRIRHGAQVYYLRRGLADYTSPAIDEFDPADVFLPTDVFSRTWDASVVWHSRLPRTPRLSAASVTLTFANSDPIARAFLAPQGIVPNDVEIYQMFDDDADQQIVTRFVGRVVGAKPAWTTIELTCEAGISRIRQKALAQVVQRPCPWALYGAECGVSLATYQVAGTATALAGSVVTVTEADAQPDGWYAGGLITFAGTHQMITAHTGANLTLLGPLSGLAEEIIANTTADVLIAPGCDLSMAACQTKFDNLDDNGGFPWMAGSPFDGRSIA